MVDDCEGGESKIPLGWADNLQHANIMNLVRIPHFGRSPEVNVVVKLLLTRVHGGYLWMDSRISIDHHLIWRIQRLSKAGLDPSTTFMDKTNEKKLAEQIKEFNLVMLGRGYDVESIEDKGIALQVDKTQ